VILLKVSQLGHIPGIACHTGRHSCFFNVYDKGQWQARDPVLKDPQTIYK
jgi:phosphoribosyl-AMP cyclohydrolase